MELQLQGECTIQCIVTLSFCDSYVGLAAGLNIYIILPSCFKMCNVQVSPELHVVLITCRNVIFYTLLTLSWVSFNLGQPALLNLGQPLFTLLLNKQAGDHIKLVLKLAHNNLFRCSSETQGKHEGFDESQAV